MEVQFQPALMSLIIPDETQGDDVQKKEFKILVGVNEESRRQELLQLLSNAGLQSLPENELEVYRLRYRDQTWVPICFVLDPSPVANCHAAVGLSEEHLVSVINKLKSAKFNIMLWNEVDLTNSKARATWYNRKTGKVAPCNVFVSVVRKLS